METFPYMKELDFMDISGGIDKCNERRVSTLDVIVINELQKTLLARSKKINDIHN